MNLKNHRKIIIINYYGKLPAYASYFFSSCKRNPSYQFVVFNNFHEGLTDENIRFINSDLQNFNDVATKTLGIPIHLDRGFKVCDLRPAYGIIYKDLIEGYDFWGFCDLDIILGRLDDFLTEELLNNIDVYSSKLNWNSGSFSLYRNAKHVNDLFRITEDWKIIFSADKYYGFDECLQRWYNKPIHISERSAEMLSIYDLIHSDDRVRSYYADSIIEWPNDIVKLKWSNGKWIDLNTGREFMYFHLLLMKNSWRFYQPSLDFSKEIIVTGLGLSEGDHTLLTVSSVYWRLRRSISCAFGIIKSIQKQGFKKILNKVKP
jgi:hypothetical protein